MLEEVKGHQEAQQERGGEGVGGEEEAEGVTEEVEALEEMVAGGERVEEAAVLDDHEEEEEGEEALQHCGQAAEGRHQHSLRVSSLRSEASLQPTPL